MWDQFHELWQTGYARLISKRRSTAPQRSAARNRGVMPPLLNRLGRIPMATAQGRITADFVISITIQ